MEDLIKNFGFPIAVAVFFIYQYIASNKEHKKDLKEVSLVSIQTLDKNTEALKENTEERALSRRTQDRASFVLERFSADGRVK